MLVLQYWYEQDTHQAWGGFVKLLPPGRPNPSARSGVGLLRRQQQGVPC